MKDHIESQEKRLLKHLQSGKTITAIEALKQYECFRLASRISNLNKKGHNIKCEMIELKSGKRIGQYKLVK